MFSRQLFVGLVAALVLLGTACSSNTSGVTPSPTTSAPASLGPSASAERDALAAYRGMWDAFVEAAKTSDPDAPDVRRHASDQALRLIVSSLATNRQQGKVTKGNLVLSPRLTEVKPLAAPTEATVLDCVDSTNWLEYKTSGELWDDKPGGKHKTTATVRLTEGTWKVSAFILEGSGTC